MSKRPTQAESVTMSGGGVYSLATKGAKDVIDNAASLVIDALDSIPLAPGGPFTMSDMGCADAGTSLNLVERVIEVVQGRHDQVEMCVVYTDQPRNDFNALIRNVHGLGPFATYMDTATGVFPLVSGSSFYTQILPRGSLHLGFSATAMHWLSGKPGDIADHVHMVGATGAELKAFREQGRADWRRILLHRANELVSGGKLVLVNFGIDEDGRYLGNTGGVNMFDTFNEIWREFLDAGKISGDEYTGMTLPQYYNTVEEFCAPFRDSDDPVYQAGLRLEHIETRVVPCPFAQDYRSHGDAGRFAAEYIPTIRTWNESTYYGALSTQRPEAERRDLIEEYYDTYKTRVRNNPEGHGMDYVHAYMVIAKT